MFLYQRVQQWAPASWTSADLLGHLACFGWPSFLHSVMDNWIPWTKKAICTEQYLRQYAQMFVGLHCV